MVWLEESGLPNKRITLSLIALGACARLAPHPWNFTPLMAIGLYAGARSAKLWIGVLVTLLALTVSDAVLGFYAGMWYVYAASLIPVLLGRLAQQQQRRLSFVAGAAIASGVSFFVITNAAVWGTSNLYPHTWGGLAACFAAAVPFYRNQIAGDAFYTVALFGADAIFRGVFHPKPQVA
jgi:uncharacterized protein DUF6580